MPGETEGSQSPINEAMQPAITNSAPPTESASHAGIKDRLLTLLHLKSSTSRDIKVKPVAVKLNREHVKASIPQEEPTQA